MVTMLCERRLVGWIVDEALSDERGLLISTEPRKASTTLTPISGHPHRQQLLEVTDSERRHVTLPTQCPCGAPRNATTRDLYFLCKDLFSESEVHQAIHGIPPASYNPKRSAVPNSYISAAIRLGVYLSSLPRNVVRQDQHSRGTIHRRFIRSDEHVPENHVSVVPAFN